MERITGISKVYRGENVLGEARYIFHLHPDGRVTGSVMEVTYATSPEGMPQIPMSFMDHKVGEPDLRLKLDDGRWVEFLCAHGNGEISGGRLVSQGGPSNDDTPSQ